MQTPNTKNRNRHPYTFANINMLGKCNVDCYFCLGKDIQDKLKDKNQLSDHFMSWSNFVPFLAKCRDNGIKKLFLTGQTTDPLLYRHLPELIDFLQDENGFSVGIRTNGFSAKSKLDIIQKLNGEVGYSIHSLSPSCNKSILGIASVPNWMRIIPNSGKDVRISIVINRYNVSEIDDLIRYCSQFSNVKYIQLRRVSTDTRYEQLKEDMDVFDSYFQEFKEANNQCGDYCLGERFYINGTEVIFWRTIQTCTNSLNYFTDGVISDEYFIVEGYLKNS